MELSLNLILSSWVLYGRKMKHQISCSCNFLICQMVTISSHIVEQDEIIYEKTLGMLWTFEDIDHHSSYRAAMW